MRNMLSYRSGSESKVLVPNVKHKIFLWQARAKPIEIIQFIGKLFLMSFYKKHNFVQAYELLRNNNLLLNKLTLTGLSEKAL